jgi:DNA-binding NarL/FixJ family response regulator
MALTVLLAERQPVVREGLRAWLESPDFDVIAEVTSPLDAPSLAERLHPDLALLGGHGGDDETAAACAQIAVRSPETATVVLAADADGEKVLQSAAAGARGYLLKDEVDADLAGILRRIAGGERIVDPTAAAALFRAECSGARAHLTEQELSVVRLVAKGCTNAEIGQRLYLSRHTVKEYLSNAMRKLEVDSRVEAVVEAGRRGLLEPRLAKAS